MDALTETVYWYRKTKKQWVFLDSTGLQDNWTGVKEKHSQPSRIHEKPVEDFFVNLENFQSQCQKYNFPSPLAPQRNVTGLEQALFLCGYFVLCQFVFMWFEAEVGPGLIPSQTTLQISVLLSRCNNPKKGRGSCQLDESIWVHTLSLCLHLNVHFIWNTRPTCIWTPSCVYLKRNQVELRLDV